MIVRKKSQKNSESGNIRRYFYTKTHKKIPVIRLKINRILSAILNRHTSFNIFKKSQSAHIFQKI